MSNIIALVAPVLLEGEQTTANTPEQWLGMLATIVPFVLIAVLFYFLLIRPQRKQEKESQAMRNSITVGDTITTIGGITGVVRQVKEAEEAYVIETGADKVRITVKKWAVQSKDNVSKEKETAVSAKEKEAMPEKKSKSKFFGKNKSEQEEVQAESVSEEESGSLKKGAEKE